MKWRQKFTDVVLEQCSWWGGAHGSCGFELHQNTGGVNILMLSFSLGLVFGLVFLFVQGAYC